MRIRPRDNKYSYLISIYNLYYYYYLIKICKIFIFIFNNFTLINSFFVLPLHYSLIISISIIHITQIYKEEIKITCRERKFINFINKERYIEFLNIDT